MGKRDHIGELGEYGGVWMDISQFPVGTTFYVCNGNWGGKIGEKNGQKTVKVYDVNDYFRSVGLYGSGAKAKMKWEKPLFPVGSDDNILSVQEVCYPPESGLSNIWDTKGFNRKGKDTEDIDNDKRYILEDETPCQYCDFSCGVNGAHCPYDDLSDSEKLEKCRVYLYFMVLKKYEHEKFD